MVPDKIYVTITYPISKEYTEIIAFEDGGDIEYIRKDTLLKWLEEQRDDAGIRDDQLDPDAIIEYNTYQTVIDELNEM